MNKFINTKTGKEVKIGDTISVNASVHLPVFGEIKDVYDVTLTEELLEYLVIEGDIKMIRIEGDDVDAIWNVVLGRLVEKTGWRIEKLSGIFTTLEEVNPWAVTQIFLKEIAIELDKKYKDHINNSEHIYAVSPQDGRIHEVNKSHIKNYKAFPAFRTVDDAKVACKIVKDIIKPIFNND